MKRILRFATTALVLCGISAAYVGAASAGGFGQLVGKTCRNSYGTVISFGTNGDYDWVGGRTGKHRTGTYKLSSSSLVVHFTNGRMETGLFRLSSVDGQIFLDRDLLTCQ